MKVCTYCHFGTRVATPEDADTAEQKGYELFFFSCHPTSISRSTHFVLISDYTNSKGSFKSVCLFSRLIPVASVAGNLATIPRPNASDFFFFFVMFTTLRTLMLLIRDVSVHIFPIACLPVFAVAVIEANKENDIREACI